MQGDAIAVRQNKTGTALMIPLHPELASVLASVPRTNLTFLMTEHRSHQQALATGFAINAT